MALILEQLDLRRAHVVRRVRLDAPGLTFGRALDRGVVLDDVHADAEHARIVRDGDGTLVLEDAGSVNGIDVLHVGRTTRLPLVAGAQFRLGRTPFRVADTAVPIPPALPLAVAHSGALPWYERQRAQVLLPLALLGLAGWHIYLGTATREAGSAALGIAIGLVAVIAVWAGIWALVGRSLVRRPGFVPHATIIAGLLLVFWVSSWVFGWGAFLFPAAAGALTTVDALLSVAALVVATFWQLGLATSLAERRRWYGALGACAVIAALVAAFALVKDDAFTDVPEFQGTIHYAPAAVVPVTDVEGFRAAITDLRTEVDSLKSRAGADRRR